MSGSAAATVDTGLVVLDIHDHETFGARRLHTRDVATQMEGLRRLTAAFVDRPETILQELVDAAVDLCGADSAGISMEQENGTEAEAYRWVAAAGRYAEFLNATLPRFPSACGICLERGRPQLFKVEQPFFDMMGIEAPTVTDGILMPWQVEGKRGTIWIMSHGRTEAFDAEDLSMMQVLADFAAMAVRQQDQQRVLMQRVAAAAVASMANELAHQINNPLQSLTNLVYLSAHGGGDPSSKGMSQELSANLERLSVLVKELLELPRTAEFPVREPQKQTQC